MKTKKELEKEIESFPFWYHKIELPHGLVTPGWAPLSSASYRLPDSLEGKRVLDVGAWDGFWTFEALKRGAKEVVAIDDFSDFMGNLESKDRKTWENFDFCKNALGYGDDVCRREELSIYDLTEDHFGRFDVVLFFGVLYHLRHPLLALDRISSVCDGEIYVETAVLDYFSSYQGGIGKGYQGNHIVAEFYPNDEYGGNETNWWVPTLRCLVSLVHAAGFRNVQGWPLMDDPPSVTYCRGFASGSKSQV